MTDALLTPDQQLESLFVSKPMGIPNQTSDIQTSMNGSSSSPVEHLPLSAMLLDRSQGLEGFDQVLSEARINRFVWTTPPVARDVEFETYLRKAKDGIDAIGKSGTRAKGTRSFQRELQWLSKNRDRFRGRWIAIQGDELLATGATAREVFRQVADQESSPLVIRIEADDLPFGGW